MEKNQHQKTRLRLKCVNALLCVFFFGAVAPLLDFFSVGRAHPGYKYICYTQNSLFIRIAFFVCAKQCMTNQRVYAANGAHARSYT